MNYNLLNSNDFEYDNRDIHSNEYFNIMNQRNYENKMIEPVLDNNVISNLKNESLDNSFFHKFSIKDFKNKNKNNNLFTLQKPLIRNKSFAGFQNINNNLLFNNNSVNYNNKNLIPDYKTKFHKNNSMKVINNIPKINFNDNKIHYEPPLYNKYSRFGKRVFPPKKKIIEGKKHFPIYNKNNYYHNHLPSLIKQQQTQIEYIPKKNININEPPLTERINNREDNNLFNKSNNNNNNNNNIKNNNSYDDKNEYRRITPEELPHLSFIKNNKKFFKGGVLIENDNNKKKINIQTKIIKPKLETTYQNSYNHNNNNIDIDSNNYNTNLNNNLISYNEENKLKNEEEDIRNDYHTKSSPPLSIPDYMLYDDTINNKIRPYYFYKDKNVIYSKYSPYRNDYGNSRYGDQTYNYYLNEPMRSDVSKDWRYPPKYYYRIRYNPYTQRYEHPIV